MEFELTDVEVRILGCLMEKEMATPEYYPLSLNALINGCNQKSNRNPVVSFDEKTVLHGLAGLQEREIVRKSDVSRVAKYEQVLGLKRNLVAREAAVICVLLLRGPQTIGEIRGRTERLYHFNDLQEVERTLSDLEENGFVVKFERQPGRKESRFGHRFSGEQTEMALSQQADDKQKVIIRKDSDTVTQLQEKVTVLQEELDRLRDEFETFKAQFE